jgi:aminobenzoyl-glutamate utilization protein B
LRAIGLIVFENTYYESIGMSADQKKKALNWISQNQSRIIEISDKIWEFAEVGFLEFKSSALLADELKKAGFEVKMEVAQMPTAFVASYGSGKPVIGVMGEYDALTGLSQKAIPTKESIVEGAPGHGCGHNIHGTSGMAGAIAAKAAMELTGMKGTVKFFGCPAEEMGSGKVFMVRDGIFDGVDAVLSHHPSSENVGGLSSSNANNAVKFHFYGVASHAAGSPDQGRSAMDAVELMNVGVNFLREHVVQEARIHYVVQDGGTQPNVVPAYARSWYMIRAPERDQVDHIYDWVLDIAKGAALMTRTTHKVEFLKGIYNKIPNQTLSELIARNMREIGAPEYGKDELEFAHEISKTITPEMKKADLRKSKRPCWEKLMDVELDRSIPDAWDEGEVSGGSTDVSDVSWKTPTMEFSSSCCVVGTPGHSWQNTAQYGMGIGHKGLIFAAKTIANSVLDLLVTPELLKKAQDEQKNRLGGRTYKPPIPPDLKPPLDMWKK